MVKEIRGTNLFLKPLERIGTRVRPLKADPKIASIDALKAKARTTLYAMTDQEAQTLLRAARKAK
jgi:hypothetical protein